MNLSTMSSNISTKTAQSTPAVLGNRNSTVDTLKSVGSYLNPLKKTDTRLPFSEKTDSLYGGPIVSATLATVRDFIEAIPRAVVTLYEETKNLGKTKTDQLPPVLSTLYSHPEYKNINADIKSRIDNGDGILSSYLGAVSQKTLDVVFGASVAATGFRTLASILEKKTPFSTIEAWKTLGSPQTEEELANNFRTAVKQFSPDPANPGSGNELGFKAITKAKQILDDSGGIPSALDTWKAEGSKYSEWLGRETRLGEPIFTPNIEIGSTIQPNDLNLPKLPGYVKESQQFVPAGLSTEPVKPVGFKANQPIFDGFSDLTTNTLDFLKGRSTVSKQFILDATNRPELKQVERDLIREVLATEKGDTINVQEFADKVKAELLPLKVNKARDMYSTARGGTGGRYENIALPDDLRGSVKNYEERIYKSPIKTSAGEVHFGQPKDKVENYFGHTRIEDMADNKTRRVIEVQSDLYQKGNLEQELPHKIDYSYLDASKIKQEPNNGLFYVEDASGTPVKFAETKAQLIKDLSGEFDKKELKRISEVKKLQQYNDPTAHFRMVREEIKKAAEDGKTKLQFPTGETAMKIEGLGQNNRFYSEINGVSTALTKPEQLKVGMTVGDGNQPWIITEVLGDGKFKAVPMNQLDLLSEDFSNMGLNGPDDTISAIIKGDKMVHDIINTAKETFDISGKVDTNNPIYKFYEKDLGRYLQNKYGAKRITDAHGVTWYEAPVNKEVGKAPVTAFSRVKLDKLADFDISKEEAQKLLRTMFDANEMAFMTTKKLINGDSLGRFSNNVLNLIKVVEFGDKLPSHTLFHEAFHGYFNTFITDTERSSILAKVKSDWSTLPHRAESLLNGYKGQDTRLEEWLADDFARYAKAKKLGETPKSIFAKLWDSIIARIRSWMDKLNKFDSLYEDILNKKRTGHVETPYRATVKYEKGSINSEELGKQKLDELKIQEAILNDVVKGNPARQLAKFANKNGELPEVLGSGLMFSKKGDDIVTELGFKNSEEARQAYQDYRKQVDNLYEIQQQIRETKLELKDLRKPIVLTEDPLLPSNKVNETQLSKLAEETTATEFQQLQDKYQSDTPYTKIVIDTSTPVKVKVGIVDYLRTPDRVLKKIGLEKVAIQLRKSYEAYLKELPNHLEQITAWSKEVSKESNQRIFRWLDGKKIDLDPTELKVATEVKEYLKIWAERLGLPEDNQISHYITHVFEIGEKQKEFDEEIAKIIKDKVPGSVYDPFLEKRIGAKGYVEDTWRALDAYVKRGTRKANMDTALEMMKKASHNLEDSQLKYVERLGARINMRPTEWDNLLDNTIKQIIGYKFGQRPTTVISSMLRKMVYRGSLGLNIGSAVKNLTQGVNTFAKLGAKDTLIGYINLLKPGSSRELSDVGVLKASFIEDRTLSSVKQTLQKIDKGLFFMFELAEKINRGSAYFGAKAGAIRRGMTEEQAVEYAKKIVRDTQFVFGSIDTPVAMQGDIAKTIFQFGSFSQKQTEFLAEMAKNKEFAGIIRYILASLSVVYTIGKVFNIDGQDFNPLNYFARFGKPPSLALPISILKAVLNIPDQYGKTPTTKAKIKNIIYSGKTLVPAGIQIDKLIGGKLFGGKTKSTKKKSFSNPFNI